MANSSPIQRMRDEARLLFEVAVDAVSPATFLPGHLPPLPETGRLVLLAAGKAGASMAAAAEAHYLASDPEAARRIAGLSITRHGYGLPLRLIEGMEAGHPVPDEAGMRATERLLAFAATVRPEDRVVFLISGGASANLVAPVAGVTLAEKQALTKALLRAGVPIGGINTVRRHLSRIKGGRLARAVAPAELVTLALSDVPGDDLAAIGSGPTIPDPSTLADARMVLAAAGIDPSPAIRAALADPANESAKPEEVAFRRARAVIAARPADAMAAVRQRAAAMGYRVVDLGADLEGEARDLASLHAGRALEWRRAGEKVALISGGELTVTLKGDGRGGPNQEYALAMALALNGEAGIAGLSADTDGTDGGVGAPTDPAGAFFDATTLARARMAGIDPEARLVANDSTGFFSAIGDLLECGPTRTNANDLRVVLVSP